jgi:hypothetical protein
MRKVAPFLTFVLVAACFYFALEGGPDRPSPREVEPASRPVAPESRERHAPDPIVATPFAESEPAAESRPESAPLPQVLVIEVVREDGRPIPDASLVIRIGDAPVSGRTGADGRAEVRAYPGQRATVAVWSAAFRLHEEEIPLDPATVRIVVPTGSRVAGRVLIAGRPPSGPILVALATMESMAYDHTAHSDAEGRFEFFNLAPEWQGRFVVEDGFEILGAGDPDDAQTRRILVLAGPNDRLEVPLVELPAIKGRILRNATLEGVQGMVMAAFSSGSETTTSTHASEPDGRFRVPLAAGDRASHHATVRLCDWSRLGTRTVELPGPFESVLDLGDVELAAVRSIAIKVRDPEGKPVAGAYATISETWVKSEPTADDGTSTIRVDGRGADLRVGKLGYATSVVKLSGDEPGPIEIELRQGNVLTIETKLPDGSAPPEGLLAVTLRAQVPFFRTQHGTSDELTTASGATESYAETIGEDEASAEFPVGADGRIVVGGFVAGAQFTVELRGRALDEILDQRFVTIGASERKAIAFTTPSMPQAFRGVVRTLDGSPIDEADVWLQVKESREIVQGYALSGAEGRFEVVGIFAPAVQVVIRKDGFVPWRQTDVPVPPPGAERDFVLTPSRDVLVEIVDEHGRAVLEPANVSVHEPDGPDPDEQWVEEHGEGTYLVRGLRPAWVQIEVTVGISYVVVDHDSRTPAVRVVVPDVGLAEIVWRREPSDAPDCRIRIDVLATGDLAAVLDVPPDASDHALDAKMPPGVYWASVEAWDPDAGQWIPIGASPAFEIAAHMTTLVEIGR